MRLGAGLAAIAIGLAAACGGSNMTFDKAAWAAERGNYDKANERGGMVAGLDEAGVRVGASRDAVRALLGEPDSTGPEADIYYLGRSRSGPSFESFRIDYSPAGVVTGTQLQRT